MCVQLRDNLLLLAVADRYKEHYPWAINMLHDYYKVKSFYNALNRYLEYIKLQGKWWMQKDQTLSARLVSQETFYGKCYNRRKLDELPYQFWQFNEKKYQTSKYVTDLSWIYEKICGSSCYQVLEDLQLVKIETSEEGKTFLETLQDFLEIYSTALSYDGRQFYSHLNYYLEDKNIKGELDPLLNSILEVTKNPPVCSLVLTNIQDVVEEEINNKGDKGEPVQDKTFDLVTRLNETDDFVVTVSTDKEEICVWDVERYYFFSFV